MPSFLVHRSVAVHPAAGQTTDGQRGLGVAVALATTVVLAILVGGVAAARPAASAGPTFPPPPTIEARGVQIAAHHAASYPRHAVAADHPAASAAGALVLAAGGNAVDAAVATSFALSVVRPMSCGIGGGGFMLVHVPGDGPDAGTFALDYRETAPARITPDWYERRIDDGAPADLARTGVHAVAVPGTVAGLLAAHERWGRLSRAAVLEPAIRLAREGFVADRYHVMAAGDLAATIARRPAVRDLAGTLWTELSRDGDVAVGDIVTNPAQANVLERIAAEGRDGFYAGPVAEAIVAVVEAGGGPLSMADLAAYRPRWLEPVRGSFLGRRVLAMPPPSSGGIAILQVLSMLEAAGATERARAPHDPEWVHAVVEALKHAFADRSRHLGDPDFADVPVDRLLDPVRLAVLGAGLDGAVLEAEAYGTIPPPRRGDGVPTDGGTSHLSVVDSDGMAVACTETINLLYGSKVEVPGFGFALNDEMDDFTTVRGAANAFGLVQSGVNLPEPGKRPLSSMSPVIVLGADDEVELVAGASGGPRIITGTLQALLQVLVFERDAGEAVAAPRLHHQWRPHVLFFEEQWRHPRTAAALEARGHRVDERGDVGHAQLVHRVRAADGSVRVDAASDPRKEGRPAGG